MLLFLIDYFILDRQTDDGDNYVQLPNALEKTGRSSWPAGYDHVTGNDVKRRPMYQRTIAVTEYLPPNTTSDRGEYDNLRSRALCLVKAQKLMIRS